MRGAMWLSGLKNALVVDIGGTTTDIGTLKEGFPREASTQREVRIHRERGEYKFVGGIERRVV